MDKPYTSPLLYPGGKRWLFPILLDLLPPFQEMVSPFMGGGSIELNFAAHGKHIYGYDTCPHLCNFWRHWLKYSLEIQIKAKETLKEHLDDPEVLSQIKQAETSINFDKSLLVFEEFYLWRAVYYYLFNRLSFQGLTYKTSSIKPYYFNEKEFDFFFNHNEMMRTRRLFPQVNRIRFIEYDLLNISIEQQDYEKTLTQNEILAYCDPPYYKIESLYASQGFDHKKLAEILHSRDNWVLSYNDVPFIHELYAGYPKKPVKMTSGFRKDGKRQKKIELLIFSHDIYDYIQQPQPQQLQLL